MKTPPYSIIFLLCLITHSKTHKAYNDIVSLDLCREVFDANTITRGGLSSHGNISLSDVQCRFKFYNTRHIKDNSPCTRLSQCSSKRTSTAVRKCSHMDNLSSTSSRSVHSTTLGTRECKSLSVSILTSRHLELSIILRRCRRCYRWIFRLRVFRFRILRFYRRFLSWSVSCSNSQRR